MSIQLSHEEINTLIHTLSTEFDDGEGEQSKWVDIDIHLSTSLNESQLSYGDFIQLKQGDILQVESEEPLEIFANGQLIAYGKIVPYQNSFGVQLTHMLDDDPSQSSH